MSRSIRRRPFAALCGGSQKRDKQLCNRIARRTNRVRLAAGSDDFMRNREALSTWLMSQDGTRHYAPYDPVRFDSYLIWWKWAKRK